MKNHTRCYLTDIGTPKTQINLLGWNSRTDLEERCKNGRSTVIGNAPCCLLVEVVSDFKATASVSLNDSGFDIMLIPLVLLHLQVVSWIRLDSIFQISITDRNL